MVLSLNGVSMLLIHLTWLLALSATLAIWVAKSAQPNHPLR